MDLCFSCEFYMPSLSSEQLSMSTGKRVGRPRNSDREVVDPREDHEKAAQYVPPANARTGSLCRSCGKPSERNVHILRSFNLVADKCPDCKAVWIEGDDGYVFDLATAAGGSLLRRAAAIYEIKYPNGPMPSPGNPIVDALLSDWSDPRWENGE